MKGSEIASSQAKWVRAAKKEKRLYAQGDKLFYIINNLILFLAFLVVIYPIIYVFSASFSSPGAVISGRVVLWPVDFSLEGYKAVFKNARILSGYANTIFYTAVGTAINIFMSVLCAYPLSRKEMTGRNLLMYMVSFTMIFSGGMLPTYMVIQQIGLLNTRWALLIPGAISAYNVIIMRTYYQSNIPEELYEAAELDGCDHFKYLWQVVIPLSKAITAVMVLYYAVGHWNAYFNAFLYLNDRELYPLQIVLREILILNSTTADMTLDPTLAAKKQGLADLLKYSLIIVSSLPVWCIYPFIQKYFVKGVMIGSVKG